MEFVTGHAGTDHISAADMAALYRGLLTSDNVVLDSGNKLSCTMLDANTAEIGTGDCMLQAHHARVEVAEQLTIQSGSAGFNRNDLIVARYSLGNDGVQAIYLAVIQGTAVAGDASDPAYTEGDIDGGDILVEFPLWRIPLTGITVGDPERIMPTIDTLQAQITSVRESVDKRPTGFGDWVNLMNYSEQSPYTAPGDGFVRMQASYRAGSYVILTIKSGTDYFDIQVNSSNNGSPGNPSQMAPVFKGQKLWAVDSSVGYGQVYYVRYHY